MAQLSTRVMFFCTQIRKCVLNESVWMSVDTKTDATLSSIFLKISFFMK